MTVEAPTRCAVDSNVIAYLFSGDAAKADRAEALVVKGTPEPVISTQVMNEVTLVMSRKMKLSWPEINVLLGDLEEFCEIVPLTLEVHKEARRIAEHYGFRFYDSCIIAFALLEDCEVLYSEDMQDGQVIFDRLTVVNPFLSPS
ncbi:MULTISPECIES: PIN domain-containing protein [unclassified Caballeronia]|uniref:PIN domain-containing protein n=1 Tax=unclassified Caballeronia TaxID=2646786 RepID=UPI00285477BF|nr:MULTISPECIES: PIN domain-containing protein [unclassified Caballeronia]MDR5752452.1 PIN domain-containing protein [Caballeronia sp. LZ024]MDR5845258.1 PIN domain-containing protein [Caballeronia sp. LZ031]